MTTETPEWAIERLRDPVFASAHVRESMRRQSEVERLSAELARVSSDRDEARAECERLKACADGRHWPHCIDNYNAKKDECDGYRRQLIAINEHTQGHSTREMDTVTAVVHMKARLARACELLREEASDSCWEHSARLDWCPECKKAGERYEYISAFLAGEVK